MPDVQPQPQPEPEEREWPAPADDPAGYQPAHPETTPYDQDDEDDS
jgi:hypothetical protein